MELANSVAEAVPIDVLGEHFICLSKVKVGGQSHMYRIHVLSLSFEFQVRF